jgi:hypothetical protein
MHESRQHQQSWKQTAQDEVQLYEIGQSSLEHTETNIKISCKPISTQFLQGSTDGEYSQIGRPLGVPLV